MLIEESMRGINSNLPVSGNTKIYEIDLTVLMGITLLVDVHLVCAPLSLNAFQHFLVNVKSSLWFSGRPVAPAGTNCRILVCDKEGAIKE